MDRELWNKCVEFHGHYCPGLAVGFQVSLAAREKLNFGSSEDEEIVCVTENDACGIDAVQVITGCTLGKGNLIYRPCGKQAFSFFRRDSDQNLRLVLKQVDLPDDRDGRMEAMLNMDPLKLFIFKEPHYELPEKAKLFNTINCEKCGEGTAEHFIRLKEGQKLCTDCAQEYSRGW